MKFKQKLNESYDDITEILKSRFKTYSDLMNYIKTIGPSIFGSVQPKSKKELKQIIKETVEREGNNADLNFIDTSLITDMSLLFKNMSGFNGKIDKWDTSNVTDMTLMFDYARSFNQPIGNWNTSNVKNMDYMFLNAESFNQPIGDWDTSKVTCMYGMFQGAKSFNQSLDDWETSKVTDMGEMFEGSKIEKTEEFPYWFDENKQ